MFEGFSLRARAASLRNEAGKLRQNPGKIREVVAGLFTDALGQPIFTPRIGCVSH
jgi:hypothetical protein